MTQDITPKAIKRLTDDCLLARDCLNKTDTFETGQSILDEAAIVLTAQAARIAELEAASAWQPIETAPDDIQHIRGLWSVYNKTGEKFWNSYLGYVDDETGEFGGEYGEDFGWSNDDFTHWMHRPTQPTTKG